MAFQVSKTTWLATESARIAAIIVTPRLWRRRWDDKSLLAALQEIGLNYTLAEVQTLNDALHKQGIVEDIGVTPAPTPIVSDVVL